MSETSLSGLQRATDYLSERQHIFPSIAAWEWWYRLHKHELAAAGAVVYLGRRIFLDPAKVDVEVRKIGVIRAQQTVPAIRLVARQ